MQIEVKFLKLKSMTIKSYGWSAVCRFLIVLCSDFHLIDVILNDLFMQKKKKEKKKEFKIKMS